jgi:hypothetical protein
LNPANRLNKLIMIIHSSQPTQQSLPSRLGLTTTRLQAVD